MSGFFIILLFSVCLLLLVAQTFWSFIDARHTGVFPWKTWMIDFYDSFHAVFPFITILSCLFMFSEMDRSKQILVFKLHGISELQIFTTFVFFGFLCTAFAFAVSSFPPYPGQHRNRTRISPVNFTTDRIFFYAEDYTKDGYVKSVILKLKKGDLILTWQAKEARLFVRRIVFYDGVFSHNDSEQRDFDSFTLFVDFDPLAIIEYYSSANDRQPFFKCRSILKSVEQVGIKSGFDWLILYSKISYPTLNFFLIMVLIPFFFKIKDLSRVKMFVIAFILTLFTYVLYSTGISLGKAGLIPWQISPWISHFVLFCFFVTYLSYAGKKMYNLG
ncbi:MAG: LptF/LptG family permease [Candidatus Omnitrophica bacterium]|nr:LptF/LptG family permease [Candidatus Omnitrophota bacterium]